jgi:glycosyltransferase involved in cell wall biosynthesis
MTKKNQRILIVCESFAPIYEEEAFLAEELGCGLIDCGYEVEIATTMLPQRAMIFYRGMTIRQFDWDFGPKRMAPVDPSELFCQNLTSGRYAAIIITASLDSWFSRTLFSIPKSSRPRTILLAQCASGQIELWSDSGMLRAVSKCLRESSAVILPQAASEILTLANSLKIETFVLEPVVSIRNSTVNFKARYGISDNLPLLIAPGSICKANRQVDLLRAMHRAQGEWRLVVTGNPLNEGPDAGYAAKILQAASHDPRVLFLPQANTDLESDAIAAADIVLIAGTGHDNRGTAVLRAMAAGVPWLADSKLPGLEGKIGGLAVGLEAFETVIPRLLKHPAKRIALGTLGRAFFEEQYSWSKTKQNYLNLIQESNNHSPGKSQFIASGTLPPSITELVSYEEKHDPYLSIIIPTCNRRSVLKQCLESVAAQRFPLDKIEVLVVDDASDDETQSFLQQYHPPFSFQHMRQEKRQGPGAARNRGVLKAKGNIVVFLNDDAVLHRDALAYHATTHQRYSEGHYSVLGRFDLPAAESSKLLGYLLQNSDLIFNYPYFDDYALFDGWAYYTCNISTPRQLLIDIGLFDTSFTGPSGEDIDIGHRLDAIGHNVIICNQCIAEHYHHFNVSSFYTMIEKRAYGDARFFLKQNHPDPYHDKFNINHIYYWRNFPTKLVNICADLQNIFEKLEGIPLSKDTIPEKIFSRDPIFSETINKCSSLWQMPENELLNYLNTSLNFLKSKHMLLRSKGFFEPKDAKDLFPHILIQRFFYMYKGFMQSPDAEKHASHLKQGHSL